MTTGNGDADVLICGAGPTGLALALRLTRSGVRVRIVDKAGEPGTTSRALVVHARTLELYRQLGLADALLAEGLRFTAANLWVRNRHVARVPLGAMGKGLSFFPYMTIVAQDRHERFLMDHLQRAGVQVERPVELLDFEQTDDRVRARLTSATGGSAICEAAYLAGCDGAHSQVREVLGMGFPGGTYSRVFYVADVDATGPVMNGELHVDLDEADLLGIFPLRGGRTARLIGTIPEESEAARAALGWEDVGRSSAERMSIQVERVNWFSTYRVHHRVAPHFRRGRAFLLGDAAHVHSPVGGQGMNTGIGDAMNLAWKLADVVHGRARTRLLDSYEPERIAFARRLVDTTDRAFVVATSTGDLARLIRTKILPRLFPVVSRIAAVQRFMFRAVSQIAINYRDSHLSAGALGRVHGGDRLPWVALDGASTMTDNFACLDGREWQVHVYGIPCSELADACRRLAIPLQVFAWRAGMEAAGLTRNGVYAVRPDGYVGLADEGASPEPLCRYVEGLRRE